MERERDAGEDGAGPVEIGQVGFEAGPRSGNG
jgi:hypothetical protein